MYFIYYIKCTLYINVYKKKGECIISYLIKLIFILKNLIRVFVSDVYVLKEK